MYPVRRRLFLVKIWMREITSDDDDDTDDERLVYCSSPSLSPCYPSSTGSSDVELLTDLNNNAFPSADIKRDVTSVVMKRDVSTSVVRSGNDSDRDADDEVEPESDKEHKKEHDSWLGNVSFGSFNVGQISSF